MYSLAEINPGSKRTVCGCKNNNLFAFIWAQMFISKTFHPSASFLHWCRCWRWRPDYVRSSNADRKAPWLMHGWNDVLLRAAHGSKRRTPLSMGSPASDWLLITLKLWRKYTNNIEKWYLVYLICCFSCSDSSFCWLASLWHYGSTIKELNFAFLGSR